MRLLSKVIVLGLALGTAYILFLNISGAVRLKSSSEETGAALFTLFSSGAEQLADFQLDEAKKTFEKAAETARYFSKNVFLIKTLNIAGAGDVISALQDLSKGALQASVNLSELKNSGFNRVLNGQGYSVIKNIENLSESLSLMRRASSVLIQYDNSGGEEILSLNASLAHASRFVSAFLDWLNSEQPRNVVIAFQNPSEIRPGGGFIGSYAHLKIKKGSVVGIDVRDIYDPDGQLDAKLIPPKAMQNLTIDWEARDANWFLDFPTSAKKVLHLLERSKIYQERGIKFDAMLAINVRVIQDILKITGPIEMKEYDALLTANNFLQIIQGRVEAGKDKKRGQPKRILQALAPHLLSRVASLSNEDKSELMKALKMRVLKKDVMLYFDEKALEAYAQVLGIGGEITPLPKDKAYDYLAVVVANIGGGKSDAFTTQKISVDSVLQNNGLARNIVKISRSHNGQNQKEWWYKTDNKTFIQIMTPNESKLLNVSGGQNRRVKPLKDYQKEGYSWDTDIKNMEKGYFRDRTIFSRWLTVPAGTSKEVVFEYEVPTGLGADNQNFVFIFDRQSGVVGGLEYTVHAPPGFLWQQSNDSVFTLSLDDPPGKVVQELTLIPQADQL